MRQTPLAQLIEAKLDRPFAEYVAEARTAGKDWRTISTEIQTETGVSVSFETLRSWFTDAFVLVPRTLEDVAAQSAAPAGDDTNRATA